MNQASPGTMGPPPGPAASTQEMVVDQQGGLGSPPVGAPLDPSKVATTPYRLSPAESWTEDEQARLEATLREYPSEQYSVATQCAQAAARLPKKSIRDVGARLRTAPGVAMPKSAEENEFSRRIEDLLKANIDVIGKMRDNLHKIDLLDNIPLMGEFDRNVAAAFSLLRRLDAKMPPFPVRVNTMYLAAGHASNASADAFDSNSTNDASQQPIDHPPNIHIPPVV